MRLQPFPSELDLKALAAYQVDIQKISVDSYPDLKLKNKALVLKENAKSPGRLVNFNVPASANLHKLEGFDKYRKSLHKDDPYWVVNPETCIEQLKVIYPGHKNHRMDLRRVDILNGGDQFAFTFGCMVPATKEKKERSGQKDEDGKHIMIIREAQPERHEQIFELYTDSSLKVYFYRTAVIRYDRMRNDYFLNIHFIDRNEEIDAQVWLRIPFPKWVGDRQEKSTAFWELFFQDLANKWTEQTVKSSGLGPGDLRTQAFLHFFGKRFDSDFKDKSTLKYKQFSAMKRAFVIGERAFGNSAMGVWAGVCIWFSENKADQENITPNLIGCKMEAFENYQSVFFKAMKQGWPIG